MIPLIIHLPAARANLRIGQSPAGELCSTTGLSFAAPEIPLGARFRPGREFRGRFLNLAIARQHPLETGV